MAHKALLLCFVAFFAGIAVPVGAQQGNGPRISPDQMNYLRTYYDLSRRQKEGRVSVRVFHKGIYQPIIEDCLALADEYAQLQAQYLDQADLAQAEENVTKAEQLRRTAQVYGDFSAAADGLAGACKEGSTQKINEALDWFLSIERFVLQNRMECLGRRWLTRKECESIVKRFGPPLAPGDRGDAGYGRANF